MTRTRPLAAIAVLVSLTVLATGRISAQLQPVASAGEDRITITLRDVPLRDALTEIGRLAGVEIAYSPDVVPVEQRVSLRLRHATLDEALRLLLAGTGIAHTHIGRARVALHARAEPAAAGSVGQVSGVVHDAESGRPLPGVTLRLGRGGPVVVTGADGSFRVRSVGGDHRLRAQGLGYRDTTVTLRVVPPTTSVVIALRPEALPLDEMVVAGTVVPTARRSIPGPVTVLMAEEIQRQGVNSIAELLRGQVPGMISPDNGPAAESYGAGRGTYVRGGSSLGSSSRNTVKIYLDGIELADPRQVHSVDPDMIERIEILRGPQASTIYGSGALDGVIQIFMKKGTASERPRLEMITAAGAIETADGSGSALVFDQQASVRGGGRRYSYNAGLSYAYTGDWIPEYFTDTRSAYGAVQVNRGRLRATAIGRLTERESALGINPYVREQIVQGVYYHTPAGVAPYNTAFDLESLTAGVTLEYTAGDRWHHALTIGGDRSAFEGGRQRPTYYWPGDSLVNRFVATTTRATYALRSTAAFDLPGVHTILTMGADSWSWRNERSTLEEDTKRRNMGVFAQAQLDFGGGFAAIAGLRADHNDNFGEDVGFVLAPRVGLAWTREHDDLAVKLRGSWGTAIRAPLERHKDFYVVTPTQDHAANPDLVPERQAGGDAGIEIYLGRSIAFEATFYDQQVTGLIDEAYLVDQDNYRLRQHLNMGDVRNRGWEFELRTEMDPVRLSASYTLIDSRVQSLSDLYRGDLRPGERMHGVARDAGSVALSWSPGAATVGALFTHIGSSRQLDARAYEDVQRLRLGGSVERADFITDHYPAVNRLQLHSSRRFGEGFEVFARVDNVTGSRANDVSTDAPVPGREYVVGARIMF